MPFTLAAGAAKNRIPDCAFGPQRPAQKKRARRSGPNIQGRLSMKKTSEGSQGSYGPSGMASTVVSRFAVRGDVQTFALVFFADAQANGQVDHLVGHERDHARPDHGDQDSLGLDPDLGSDGIVSS